MYSMNIIDKDLTALSSNLITPVIKDSGEVEQDSDSYLYFRNRALSSSLLEGVLYLDLTNIEVLKQNAYKLKDKTVFANHNTDTSKWVGKVIESSFNELSSPQGIDTLIRVPKPGSEFSYDYNKAVALGLISGNINSFSVGVHFKLEHSHPDMDIVEFVERQGEVVDGEVVRTLVTDIKRFTELSVVHEGYDPDAKIQSRLSIDGGLIGKPDHSITLSSRADLKQVVTELHGDKKIVVPMFNPSAKTSSEKSQDFNINVNLNIRNLTED